jgi:hypothetical protein
MFFVFRLAFEMNGDRRMMYDGWRKDGAHSNEWMVVTKAFLGHAFKDATGRVAALLIRDLGRSQVIF